MSKFKKILSNYYKLRDTVTQCFEMYFSREQFWCAPVFWDVFFEGLILRSTYIFKCIFWGSNFEEHLCFEMHFWRALMFWNDLCSLCSFLYTLKNKSKKKTNYNNLGIRALIIHFALCLLIWLKVAKIMKIFISVILFYGNKNVCLFGVSRMVFTCIVTFKNYF